MMSTEVACELAVAVVADDDISCWEQISGMGKIVSIAALLRGLDEEDSDGEYLGGGEEGNFCRG